MDVVTCTCDQPHQVRRVVLTGGPGGPDHDPASGDFLVEADAAPTAIRSISRRVRTRSAEKDYPW